MTIICPNTEQLKNALSHEMEILAKTLRPLLGRPQPGWARSSEFTADMMFPIETTPDLGTHIRKLYNRWKVIKDKILEIDPKYFSLHGMDTGLFYCPYIPLMVVGVNGTIISNVVG